MFKNEQIIIYSLLINKVRFGMFHVFQHSYNQELAICLNASWGYIPINQKSRMYHASGLSLRCKKRDRI